MKVKEYKLSSSCTVSNLAHLVKVCLVGGQAGQHNMVEARAGIIIGRIIVGKASAIHKACTCHLDYCSCKRDESTARA